MQQMASAKAKQATRGAERGAQLAAGAKDVRNRGHLRPGCRGTAALGEWVSYSPYPVRPGTGYTGSA